MQPFNIHHGIAAPLPHANIDTDQIIPKQFLQAIDRQGFGRHLFHDWRYLDDAGQQPNPDFILNQPPFDKASILITGDNMGCGSSREHAPWALADFGIRVIIAPGFADIFRANCINNGILPISLDKIPHQQLLQLCQQQPTRLTVDLPNGKIDCPYGQWHFHLDEESALRLQQGLDAIALTLQHQEAITAFENGNPGWSRLY